jgi:hypothetical protein
VLALLLFRLCTILCALFCVHYFVYTILCTLFCVHYFVYTILCALFCVHYFVCTILCALFCVHYFVCTILCTLFCVHYFVYTILCTLFCVHYFVCTILNCTIIICILFPCTPSFNYHQSTTPYSNFHFVFMKVSFLCSAQFLCVPTVALFLCPPPPPLSPLSNSQFLFGRDSIALILVT